MRKKPTAWQLRYRFGYHPFDSDSKYYFLIQVHYNNVDGVEGLVDNSGFSIRLSTQLRRYDMAVMLLVRLVDRG